MLALYGLGCLAFVAQGVWFILYPSQAASVHYPRDYIEATGWLAVAFFGSGLAIFLIALAKPSYVALGPDGLTIRLVFGSRTHRWAAVSNFRVWRLQRRRVAFDDADQAGAGRRGNISGTRLLPGMLNARPEQLLEELKWAKEKWG
ncbi:MAG TPA: STM3941 family protein [Caulobacteraceae bacterium]|nr:STM3941 family protein [Caulobacteraceae bacterium]